MHNAMWAATVGSMYQMQRMDVIANNLANANTVGFKADQVSFKATMSQIQTDQFAHYRDNLSPISASMITRTTFAPGIVQDTKNSMDVAILGDGFFAVQTTDGLRYTRAGNFTLDPDGQITTSDGHVVLGEGGPIQIRDGLPFEIDEIGKVYQDGNEIGKLLVTKVTNPETLEKVSGKMFKPTGATRTESIDAPDIKQGALESSNVNIIREMTYMVQAGRAFEAYQQVIGLMNNINQQALSKIASQQ